jgi:hypothetical protein
MFQSVSARGVGTLCFRQMSTIQEVRAAEKAMKDAPRRAPSLHREENQTEIQAQRFTMSDSSRLICNSRPCPKA